MYTGVNDTT
jgi:hypothetical protein